MSAYTKRMKMRIVVKGRLEYRLDSTSSYNIRPSDIGRVIRSQKSSQTRHFLWLPVSVSNSNKYYTIFKTITIV